MGAGKVFQTPELLHGKKRKRRSAVSGNWVVKLQHLLVLCSILVPILILGYRYQREEAKIQAWVNLQNAKAEAQSRKLEVLSHAFVYLFFSFFCFLTCCDLLFQQLKILYL